MAITNGYCTLAELKTHINVSDTADDTLLERAIESASRTIDHHTGQRFWEDGVDRTAHLTTTRSDLIRLADADKFEHRTLTAVTTLQTDTNGDGTASETLTENTHFVLEPRDADTDNRPYTAIRVLPGSGKSFPTVRYGVIVTGTFGWPAVPTDIEQACLLLASRLFYRKNTPEGVVGVSEFGTVRISAQDRDVQALLAPYRPVLVA